MILYATTIGDGPYKPVIMVDSTCYALNQEHNQETSAFKVAQSVLASAEAVFVRTIEENKFRRT